MENKTQFVPIAAYKDNEIQSKLAIEYNLKKPFNSIFGKLRSLKPVIYLINYTDFNPIYLTKPMTQKERMEWVRKRRKRFTPNGTEIFKLVATDRLLADRDLLQDIKDEFGTNLDDIIFVPYIKIKRGVITTEQPNRNLKVFGLVLTRVLRMIMDEFEDVNIKEISKEEFHEKKLKVKEKVWNDVEDYLKERPILKDLVDDVTDEEVKERFMR